MKTVIGLSRDHSGSMRSIARPAAKDYNNTIASIREAANSTNQNTIVSVVECGYDSTNKVRRIITNSVVNELKPINESSYVADGVGTPLFDSVGELIELFEASPDVNDPDVSFLIMVVTDGAENASQKWSAQSISEKIRSLQNTDRWTFVFRVPRGYSHTLTRLGIPAGNIQEWDQTERGMHVSSVQTQEAFTEYMSARSRGVRSTGKFYVDLSNVKSEDVAATLEDISKNVLIWPVGPGDNDVAIRDFVESRLAGEHMLKGAAFYELSKQEDEVQATKKILIRDKTTKAIYFGAAARQLLGVPSYGMIKLVPQTKSNFDVFIQSTSVNRKLKTGTDLVYWKDVGVKYQEGPSAY